MAESSWQSEPKTNLQLDNVRVQGAFAMIEQLPRDDPLAGVAATLQKLDGHNLARFCVFCQLDEAGGSSAHRTVRISVAGLSVLSKQVSELKTCEQLTEANRTKAYGPKQGSQWREVAYA